MDSKPTKYSILALAMVALGMADHVPGGQDDRRDGRDGRDGRDDYRIRHVGEYDQTLVHRWGDRDNHRGKDDKTIDITVILPQPQPPQPPRPQPRPPVQPSPQSHGAFSWGGGDKRWQWKDGRWEINR